MARYLDGTVSGEALNSFHRTHLRKRYADRRVTAEVKAATTSGPESILSIKFTANAADDIQHHIVAGWI